MHLCLKLLCAKAFCAQCFFFATDFSLTVRAVWRAEQLRWVEKNLEEMRKVDQCPDEMKTVEKNLLRWHVRRDGMRWEELKWGQLRWEELTWLEMRWKYKAWSAKCEVWSKGCEECSVKCAEQVRLALNCDVIARRSCSWTTCNNAIGSHTARKHELDWRTAHASSIHEKGLIV